MLYFGLFLGRFKLNDETAKANCWNMQESLVKYKHYLIVEELFSITFLYILTADQETVFNSGRTLLFVLRSSSTSLIFLPLGDFLISSKVYVGP